MQLAKKTRRGRTRKLDAIRQPDGRVKPHIVGPTAETRARRSDLLCRLIAEHPQRFAAPLALDPDAGWYCGRLYLVGVLTQRQKDAAERYRKAVAAYQAVLKAGYGAPEVPRALDMNRVAGASSESDDVHNIRFRRAKREYDLLHDAVSSHGHDVVKAVTDALHDRDVRLDWLRKGLDAIDGA